MSKSAFERRDSALAPRGREGEPFGDTEDFRANVGRMVAKQATGIMAL